MDNYKIKVKDEAKSKEAQELFFELGFRWEWTQDKEVLRGSTPYLFTLGVNIGYGLSLTKFDECVGKELTLPQLRDLVVLKRNDINDATHTCENDFKYICIDERWHLMTTDGWFHVSVNPKALKPINQPQDPALISGAEALRALADGKEVEANNSDFGYWIDARNLSVKDFFDDIHIFRLKPQTIKLELELPKPFEPKEDGYVYIIDDYQVSGYRKYYFEVEDNKELSFIGVWHTEDEIKQVVAQLRKIRGTNS
ncbi:hypothetical protein [Acinetobacter baumannii]|uniref:hypothetical protein n=1 Tax=Acinetobacter baumannii TaxID=470 RepID=UPI00215EF20D|nr:hypothetical protein [Acinetobacter baumannii]MDB0300193.1 hypothetical protein [Acinetobacter baumannii]